MEVFGFIIWKYRSLQSRLWVEEWVCCSGRVRGLLESADTIPFLCSTLNLNWSQDSVLTTVLISARCDFQSVTAGWSSPLHPQLHGQLTQSNRDIKLKRREESEGQYLHRLPSLAASQWCSTSSVTTSVFTPGVWQLCGVTSSLSAHVNVLKWTHWAGSSQTRRDFAGTTGSLFGR